MSKLYFGLTAIIFAVVALGHLLRSLQTWQVQVGPYSVPMWVSWSGFVVASVLAIWGFVLIRR